MVGWDKVPGLFGDEALRASDGHSVEISGATRATRYATGEHGLTVSQFPFRIGRVAGPRDAHEPHCDLRVTDSEPYQVSRLHCRIVWNPALAAFYVEDAGSKLGTTVNGERIGRQGGRGAAPLSVGENRVVLGGTDSPFEFVVTVRAGS